MITVLQFYEPFICLIPVRQHGFHSRCVLFTVILIMVRGMEIACGCAQFLFCPPLPAKPVIFLITAAILILLVVAFNPFRGRMAHAVCFAVIIISGIAVPGISICIRGQDVTDIIVFRFRRHAVYIDLSAGPIRFAFLIPLLIYLGKIKIFPHVEYSSL